MSGFKEDATVRGHARDKTVSKICPPSTLDELDQLKVDIDAAVDDDDVAFHALVRRAFWLAALSDADVSRQFGMSRPSIMRWRTGRSAPHPAMRRHVYEWMASKVQEAIAAEYQRSADGSIT